VALHDGVDRGEAETCALAGFLGREEGFEDAVLYLGGHPGAGVFHADQDVGPGSGGQVQSRIGRIEHLVLSFQREGPGPYHGVPGIDAEIEQELVQLGRVARDVPEIPRDVAHHGNRLGEGLPDDGEYLLDEVADLDGCPLPI